MSFNTILSATKISAGLDLDIGFFPSIASLSNGSFAVTYEADDLSNTRIVSQVFDGQGQLVQGSFAKPLPHLGDFDSDVASLTGGSFALVWEEMVFDTTGTHGVLQVFTAVYDSAGNQISPPVGVDANPTLHSAQNPHVTALTGGGYVVTWLIRDSVQGTSDLMAAVYDSAGQQLVAPINVTNSPGVTDEGSFVTTAAPLANGSFALTWTTVDDDFIGDVYTAIYDAQGQLILAPFNVTHSTGTNDNNPQIAVLANGNYALTWGGIVDPQGTAQLFAYTAVFDAQGNQIATPSVVGIGQIPHLGALTNGGYAVMWYDFNGVFAAVYDGQGHQLVAPFTVSDAPGLNHTFAGSVTALPNGAFALTWNDQIADGSMDIFTAVYDSHGQQLVAPVNVSNSPGVDDAFETVHAQAQANGSYAITWQGPGSDPFFASEYLAIYQFTSDQIIGNINLVGSPDINVDLSAVINVGGDVIVTNNGNLVTIDLHNLASVGGNFVIGNNGALLTLTLPSILVGGAFNANHNATSGDLDLNGITAGGIIDISANAVGGDLDIGSVSGNGVINASANAVSGNLDITSASGGTVVDVSANATGGDLDIGSVSSGVIDVSGNSVGGSIDIGSATAADVVNANDNVVSGNLDLNSVSSGVVNVSANAVGGDLDLADASGAGIINVSENAISGSIDIGSATGTAGVINVNDNLIGSGNLDLSQLDTAVDIGISGNTVVTIDLHALVQAGAIVIANNGVVTLNLSALVKAGGNVSVSGNHSLLSIDMPNLAEVSGNFTIASNSAAGSIDFGDLTGVSGAVSIGGNTAAGSVDVGSLTSAGSVDISNNTDATTIDLGSLTTVSGSVSFEDNTATGSVDLGSLESAGGAVSIGGNKAAGSVDLGSLTSAGSVDISGNDVATVIDLGSLTAVAGSVDLDLSPDATVDASALGPGGGTVRVIGDDGRETTVILGSLAQMQGTLTITTADGVTLTSAAGLQTITLIGTPGDNTLIGSTNAKNVINAGGGDDAAIGGSNDDLFTGGAGNDAFDGRSGTDTAVYSGNFADYTVVRHADGSLTLTDIRPNSPDGADMLRNVELFRFADGTRTLAEVLPAPVITSNGGGDSAQLSMSENATAVTLVAASNPNAVQSLEFTIAGGADAGKFQIDKVTGALSFVAAPDFEHPNDTGANHVYDVIVQVSDGFHFDTQAQAVSVSDVNEAPVAPPLAAGAGEDGPALSQNLLAGASDPDAGTQLSIANLDATVVTSGGRMLALGTDYTLDGSTLALTQEGFAKFNSLGALQNDQAVFHFGVSDGLLTTSNALTLTVTGANDAPTLASQTPDQLASSGKPFSLTLPANTFQDPDSGDHLMLGATLGNGNPLPGWLNFNAATGAFSGTPGAGDVGGFDVEVTATDTGGLKTSDVFHFSVSGPSANHAPVITSDLGGASASVIITDDTKYVATVHAVDPEPNTTITYSIVGGADQKLFAIDPRTGVLTFKKEPQDGHSYNVTVAASDGSLQDTQAIKVQVANGPFEAANGSVADTFVFKPHFGLAVITNFDAASSAHDVLELDHALFRNAGSNASPATFDLIQHHSFQLGNDVVIVTDSLDVIDLRNTDVHALTASNFLLI